jgi:hypothetical protein
MPIKINLLAEQQAAEELRRKDPIKRAVFAGVGLMVLMIGWIAMTQMQVWAARYELNTNVTRLKKVEESSKQAKNRQVASLDAESRLKALDRYAANRFFWGTFLDALQHVAVDSIRLTEVRAEQKYNVTDSIKLFTTNLVVKFTPPPARWKFWDSSAAATPIPTLVSNTFTGFTNTGAFLTNTFPYTVKITETATNVAASEIATLVEFNLAPRAIEKTTIEIRGRDYGSNPGAALDEFAKRLTASPYFKSLLSSPQGFRFTERPPQARPDPQDPVNPNALFVPFTIELVLNERIFTNEQNL